MIKLAAGRMDIAMFESREDAGRRLAAQLHESDEAIDLVLGLPRGGVVVAAQVAHELHRTLDVLIVRKLGHPHHREFAVGALAEPDVMIVDKESLGWNPTVRALFHGVVEEERERLHAYRERFHLKSATDLTARVVVLVDDGLATGATMEAAVRSCRVRKARRIIVAAPVASDVAVERLKRIADEVIVDLIDEDFSAVGEFYRHFEQTTDEEVVACLRAEHAVF